MWKSGKCELRTLLRIELPSTWLLNQLNCDTEIHSKIRVNAYDINQNEL